MEKEVILERYHQDHLIMDWSREETFNRCAREAYWAYEIHLEPREIPSDPLDFGSRLHKHLETRDAQASWANYKERGTHSRDYRTRAKGQALVEQYEKHLGRFDRDAYEVLDQEVAWGYVIHINHHSVLLKGTMDGLWRDKFNGLMWCHEAKHTAQWTTDENFFAPFFLGGQALYYLNAMRRVFREAQLGGIIIDLFRVTRKETTPEDFSRKIIEVQEIPEDTHQGVISEWLWCRETKFWRQNVNACRRYNRVCPFYALCRFGANEANLKNYREKTQDEWHW
jgi:hypothetical protein